MDRQKILDVFPNGLTGSGIFSALQGYAVPWQVEDIATELDLEYHGNISGEKYISPLVNKVKAGLTLTTEEINKLAGVIYTMNHVNWEREWNTLFEDYDPITNYSMIEQMTNDTTVNQYGRGHTRTDNLSNKTTGSDTVTDTVTGNDTVTTGKSGSDVTTPNVTTNDTTSVYGFNSSSAVNSGAGSSSTTGSTTTTYGTTEIDTTRHNTTDTETVTHNTTNTNTGTVTDTDSGSDSHTRNYRLTRSGNIGVTTSQQMIQSERELYMWNFFYNVVFPDIDKVLTLNIY